MGFIYLINELDSSNYKIGLTKNETKKRRSQLQTGNAGELMVVREYKTEHPSKLEKLLHMHYFSKRGIGEWFYLTDEDVVDFTAQCDKFSKIVNVLVKENQFYN